MNNTNLLKDTIQKYKNAGWVAFYYPRLRKVALKYGLSFGIVKHPIFKNEMILTMNGIEMGEPERNYRDLYSQAVTHLYTLIPGNYSYGKITNQLKLYTFEL